MSDGACGCIYVDPDSGPEVHSESYPVARKQHRCSVCKRTIEPGEQYEYVWGIWEDGQGVYKTCCDCLSIRKAFFCEGWYYEGVLLYVRNHIAEMDGNISSECLEKLTKRARSIVVDMIDEYMENDAKGDFSSYKTTQW